MNSRDKRFILKREGGRELKKSRACISRVPRYFITSRATQAPFPLSPGRTQPYRRTAYRTPQRNPLLSLGPDPHSASVKKHMIITPQALPAPFPHLQAPLLTRFATFPSPENSPSTHRQTDTQTHAPNFSAPENLPTYPARSTIPPSLFASSSAEFKQATRAPHKKENENRAGQKSKK